MPSVSDQILAKIVAALEGVVWDPAPPVEFVIAARKTLTATQKDDTAVIVVARDGVEATERIHATQELVTYPVAIAFGLKESAKYGDTEFTNWRQQGQDIIVARASWSGLEGWSRTADRPTGTVVDPKQIKAGWRVWSVMGFAVEVLQSRA